MLEKIEQSFYSSSIKVQWGDMDAAMHVNNVMYLRWAETARIRFYEKLSIVDFDFQNLGIILSWQDCKYIFPATYPDTILITYDITEVLEDRLIGECRMYSKKHDRIIAISKSSVMAYNYKELKKVAIPQDWKETIAKVYKTN
jgi:acyl-CoA thioester hydrolase